MRPFPIHIGIWIAVRGSNRFRKVTFLIIQLEVTELILLSLWLTCICLKQSLLLSVLCNLICQSRTIARPLEKIGWSLNASWGTGTENKARSSFPEAIWELFLNDGYARAEEVQGDKFLVSVYWMSEWAEEWAEESRSEGWLYGTCRGFNRWSFVKKRDTALKSSHQINWNI